MVMLKTSITERSTLPLAEGPKGRSTIGPSRDLAPSFCGVPLVPGLAMLSCVIYCINGELLQWLQTAATDPQAGLPSLLLNLCLCHLGGLFFAPHFAGYQPPGIKPGRGLASSPRLVALIMSLNVMAYNYAVMSSAKFMPMGVTNAVFQTSVAFVFLASVALFGQPLNLRTMCGVALAIVGPFLACGMFTDGLASATSTDVLATERTELLAGGMALAVAAALGYTMYQVSLKFLFGNLKNDWRFLAFFGSWVSIWHVLVVLPFILLADLVGLEKLEFPRSALTVAGTATTALMASTVNALWLLIPIWGTPMMLSCASALSVPCMVFLDALLHGLQPTRVEVLGHSMVVLSVSLILGFRIADLFQPAARPTDPSPAISC